MADELNIPTHRWYEARNHIKLPPNTVSKKWIYANGVALIDAWINSQPWGNPFMELFANGEQGFTFEPWDITTLFQDRAGTTPVTAAGQSVGLRLDKSKGLALGAELVTNGDFSAGLTGWSNTGSSISVWESGAARWSTATADFSGFRSASFTTVIGKTYEFTATVSENTGAAWRIILVNGDGSYSNGTDNYIATGTKTARFVATQMTSFIEIRNGTAATANRLIDNISVKELAGNHQVAISDAKRGVYGWMPKTGRRNLLTYTEQFDNAVWGKTNATVTANAAVAPDGTMTADKLVGSVSALANRNCCVSQGATFTAGADYTLTFHSALAETPHVVIYVDNSGGLQLSVAVNLSTGVATAFNYAGVSAGPTDAITVGSVVNGHRKITLVFRNQGYSTLRIASSVSQPTSTGGFWWNADGDGTSGILIWGAQLETGTTATAYQRVNSQYDITEAGVPTCYYVQADGVDDAYVTPTITPGTDKAQVFAGVWKLSDASSARLVEFSVNAGSNSGAFYLSAPDDAANLLRFISRGTSTGAASSGTSFASPVNVILTGLGDISGDTATLRVNGTQVAQSTADQGTGNYLAYPAYIYSRGGTSLPFNGLDFGHAVRFGPNLDAATIARVEAAIARNTPEVTL